MPVQPTVFHITHWKAGSQWVAAILRECAPDRFVTPVVQSGQLLDEPIHPGGVYPSVYMSRPLFEAIRTGNPEPGEAAINSPWSQAMLERFKAHPSAWQENRLHFVEQQHPYKKLVVLRDLRDTLISYYFSAKVSHKLLTERQAFLRDVLNDMTEEEGLIRLIHGVMRQVAPIQQSWVEDEEALHVSYEDLLADEVGAFEQILDHAEIDVTRDRLHAIIQKHSFKKVSGRARGTEDISAHHRKGIAGDWRNHFSENIKEVFKRHHGDVLIHTGYEKDLDW